MQRVNQTAAAFESQRSQNLLLFEKAVAKLVMTICVLQAMTGDHVFVLKSERGVWFKHDVVMKAKFRRLVSRRQPPALRWF